MVIGFIEVPRNRIPLLINGIIMKDFAPAILIIIGTALMVTAQLIGLHSRLLDKSFKDGFIDGCTIASEVIPIEDRLVPCDIRFLAYKN